MVALGWVTAGLAAPHRKVSSSIHQTPPVMIGSKAQALCSCKAHLSYTVAILWLVLFLPPLTFHSLVLEPGLNLSAAKVQEVGKFLHLLEAEVFLSLKSLIEYTEPSLGEDGSHYLFLDLAFFLLLCTVLYRSEQYYVGTGGRTRALLTNRVHGGRKRRDGVHAECLSR